MESSLWKGLWTCRKTDCQMNVWISKGGAHINRALHSEEEAHHMNRALHNEGGAHMNRALHSKGKAHINRALHNEGGLI